MESIDMLSEEAEREEVRHTIDEVYDLVDSLRAELLGKTSPEEKENEAEEQIEEAEKQEDKDGEE